MDAEFAPQSESSSSRCSATTAKGEPCKAYALSGSTTCRLHSLSPEERKAAATHAAARSAEARASVVEEREDKVRQARLGLQARLAEELEAEAVAVTARLRRLALSDDDGTALQGIKLWLERVHGRAVQPTADVTEERNPLVEAFASLSPEERRAMLRLARNLPEDINPAAAEG